MSRFSWSSPVVTVAAVVVAHVLLALAALSPAMHPGGDNAAYVTLAHSLASEGVYAELWHPGAPPHTMYPPLYPGFLALLMLLGAKSWGVLKVSSVFFTGVAVVCCLQWVRRLHGVRLAGLLALLFGISPAVMYHTQWILAEPFFLALTFGCFWALTPGTASGRAPSESGNLRDGLSHGRLAVGLALVIAAYFTRSAGLPLVVAAAIWLSLQRRWVPLAVFVAAFASVAVPWQSRAGGQYASAFWLVNPYAPDLGTAGPAELIQRVVDNLKGYALDHVPAGMTGLSGALAAALGTVLAVAALVGWWRRVRGGPAVADIFFVLYSGLILLWPTAWSGDRFALPLFPLVLLYAGEAAALGAGRVLHRPAWAMGVIAAVAFLLPAGNSWLDRLDLTNRCRVPVMTLGPMGCYGNNIREFHVMALWARDGLPEGSVVFSRKPRIFHVFSGHASVTYPFTNDRNSLLVHADSLGVDHLVLGNWDSSGPAYVHPVIAAHPERFCLVAQLEAGEGEFISLLAIRPPPAGDALETATTAEVGTCLRESPVPSNAAMASMIVPILDEP